MKYFSYAIIILLIIFSFVLNVETLEKSDSKFDYDLKYENNIMIITDKNYQKVIEKYENIFIVFYAPWCGNCKKLLPILEKVAATLSQENIIIAKLDATKETKTANRNKILSYPTLKFFKENTKIKYTGKRDEQNLISWIREKASFNVNILKKLEEIELFKKNKDVSVIYFGKEEKNKKIFRTVAFKKYNIPFAIVEDEKIAQMYKAVYNSVVMFKKFDEKRNDLFKFDLTKLKEFIKIYSKRRILELNNENINLIFNHHTQVLIYFGRKDDLYWRKNEKNLEKIALNVETKLKFIMTEIKEGNGKMLADKIKLNNNDLPCIMILDILGTINKYKYVGNYEYNDIIRFIENWEKGLINKYVLSQPEPTKNNGNVFILVGNSFNKKVLDNDDDIIVLFYSPLNNESLRMLRLFEEVAKKLNVQNRQLIFAKIDMSENEISSFIIRDFPTIKFFAGNRKHNAPVEYRGGRKADDLIKFIKKYAFHKVIDEDEFINDL